MAKVTRSVLLRLAGKFILLVYVVVLFFVNYRWHVSREDCAKNFTSTNTSLHYFIPACFSDIQELVNSSGEIRWRLDIRCNKSEVDVIKHEVHLQDEPCRLSWTDNLQCLKSFVRDRCYSRKEQAVPNVIHYVWFGHLVFKAENFVSVLSTVRFQQPCAIMFHAQELPFGPYWTVLLSIVPNIIHVQRKEPMTIFGKKFGFIQHKADIVRLEVLHALGGIYLDNDQLLVRDVHELLNKSFVMSHESNKNLANSMILARPGAPFIDLWYAQYRSYNPTKWGYHSTYVPWDLARQHSDLITVVQNRFVNPDLTNILKVVKAHYNLSSNYGLHLYTRFHPELQLKLPQVTRWNTSLGELWRTILYNSSDIFNCSLESS